VFKSSRGLWILSCEEAIQLAYGTLVILLTMLVGPKIMQWGSIAVFFYQESWKIVIWPLLCWCNITHNEKINYTVFYERGMKTKLSDISMTGWWCLCCCEVPYIKRWQCPGSRSQYIKGRSIQSAARLSSAEERWTLCEYIFLVLLDHWYQLFLSVENWVPQKPLQWFFSSTIR
jgi:hypothetical protein